MWDLTSRPRKVGIRGAPDSTARGLPWSGGSVSPPPGTGRLWALGGKGTGFRGQRGRAGPRPSLRGRGAALVSRFSHGQLPGSGQARWETTRSPRLLPHKQTKPPLGSAHSPSVCPLSPGLQGPQAPHSGTLGTGRCASLRAAGPLKGPCTHPAENTDSSASPSAGSPGPGPQLLAQSGQGKTRVRSRAGLRRQGAPCALRASGSGLGARKRQRAQRQPARPAAHIPSGAETTVNVSARTGGGCGLGRIRT